MSLVCFYFAFFLFPSISIDGDVVVVFVIADKIDTSYAIRALSIQDDFSWSSPLDYMIFFFFTPFPWRDHTHSLTLMSPVPNVGAGKDAHTLVGLWGYLNSKIPFIEVLWERLGFCGWIIVSERHRYAFVWPDKHGTSPMAHDGYNVKNVAEEREGNRVP